MSQNFLSPWYWWWLWLLYEMVRFLNCVQCMSCFVPFFVLRTQFAGNLLVLLAPIVYYYQCVCVRSYCVLCVLCTEYIETWAHKNGSESILSTLYLLPTCNQFLDSVQFFLSHRLFSIGTSDMWLHCFSIQSHLYKIALILMALFICCYLGYDDAMCMKFT